MNSYKNKLLLLLKKTNKKFLIKLGLAVILINLVISTALVGSIWAGFFGPLPTVKTLKNIQNNVATEVYSSDQVLLGKYYLQDRTNVDYNDLPEHLKNALVATEDARFYSHNGIDWRGFMRVLVKTIILGDRSSGGGSTISQQLAKNLFPRNIEGWWSMPVIKIKEAIIAKRLENIFTKEEILTLYLNTVPFGENVYGIETAAQRFFSKEVKNLSIQESAVLVGMLKANTSYNPRLNPKRAKNRRNVVLSQMTKYGYLDITVADSVKQLPIELQYKNLAHYEGPAPYFREWLRSEVEEWIKDVEKPDGTDYNIYTDGLKIYTTIDSRLQKYAEQSVKEHLKSLYKDFKSHWGRKGPWSQDIAILENAIYRSSRYKKLKAKGLELDEIKKEFSKKVPMTIFTWDGEKEMKISPLDSVKHYLYFMNAGFMAMEPQTGEIRAWVGGINHKYFKYDHVNINTRRQVGSTFKPFVYAAALENGTKPCEYIANEQMTYEAYDNWSPRNADNQYGGYYSMQGALTNSVNTIAVQLLMKASTENVISFAADCGIENEINEVPSIALGTASLSLYEMVSAYCTFANQGKSVKPVFLSKIEDEEGQLIYEHERQAPVVVMEEENAQIMLEMMKSVINQGTGRRLRYQYNLKNEMAGKTGTTQSHADGWFIGITPRLVGGAWVGSDDPRIHFRSLALGQGAHTALPVWGRFLSKVNRDKSFRNISRAQFPVTSPDVQRMLACNPFVEQLPEERNFFDRLFGSDQKPKKLEENKTPSKRKRRIPPRKKKRKLFDRIKNWFD